MSLAACRAPRDWRQTKGGHGQLHVVIWPGKRQAISVCGQRVRFVPVSDVNERRCRRCCRGLGLAHGYGLLVLGAA